MDKNLSVKESDIVLTNTADKMYIIRYFANI